MDKYLLEILKDVNTIIIPGLGALTITDYSTGEIMFMSYLKHDDGALVNYIAEKEGMDPNDAKNLVAKYVREILAKLDQGESYDMFQFGSFYKNDDDVDFKAWKGTKVSETSTAKENKIQEDSHATEPEDNVFIPPVSEEIKEEKIQEINDEAKVNEPEITAATETTPEPTREFNIAEKEEQEKNKTKLEKLKKAKESKKEKKKKGIGFYLLISMIVLIVAGGSLVGIYFDEVRKHIPFLAEEVKSEESDNELDEMKETLGMNDESEESSEETSDESIEDTQAEETTLTDVEETVNETVEEPKTTSYPEATPGKYHIIAGAFSSIDNANRMAAKLNDGGYQASVKMQGSLHFVSAKSFDTKEAANSELGNVRTIASNAWVYAWP